MTNFIFSRPKTTSKKLTNTPDSTLGQLRIIQSQNRYLRQDLVDVKLMLNKLLIDKHLQMQVDEYFEENNQEHPEDTKDLD